MQKLNVCCIDPVTLKNLAIFLYIFEIVMGCSSVVRNFWNIRDAETDIQTIICSYHFSKYVLKPTRYLVRLNSKLAAPNNNLPKGEFFWAV